MSEYHEEEAKNGTVFRDMNEWTAEANDARSGPDRPIDLYLCSDPLCAEPINLTRPEYEAMRTVPVRVAISLNPEIDELLFENERFATAGPSTRSELRSLERRISAEQNRYRRWRANPGGGECRCSACRSRSQGSSF
jgi:hypothetical protein